MQGAGFLASLCAVPLRRLGWIRVRVLRHMVVVWGCEVSRRRGQRQIGLGLGACSVIGQSAFLDWVGLMMPSSFLRI